MMKLIAYTILAGIIAGQTLVIADLESANEFLKHRIDLKSSEISTLKKEDRPREYRVFWHKQSAYILKECEMIKLHSIKSLQNKINNGYLN